MKRPLATPTSQPRRGRTAPLVLLSCLLAASLVLSPACSLTIDEEALQGPNLHCSEAEKQCDVDGQAECVPLENPDFGCSSVNCAPCYLHKATATCSPRSGECIVAACIGSWDDCDQLEANGCEVDLNSDPNNCGGCEEACPDRPHAEIRCGSARCYIRVCESGFLDCNEDVVDGCETELAVDSNGCEP